jgi:7-cyano-7-deazaguanine synthase
MSLPKYSTDSVAIVSGGLDSVTLVYHMLDIGLTPHLLSFNYGQQHKKEIGFARTIARQLQLPHDEIGFTNFAHLIDSSALTSTKIAVPEGHYAEKTMKTTVVANRNMMMIALAAAVAVAERARTVAIGVHSGDHFIYPDCRPEFIEAMNIGILLGNDGFHSFGTSSNDRNIKPSPLGSSGALFSPFIRWTKADIAYRALKLNVPIHLTWSCYKGGNKHCGRCGTCVERLEAINVASDRLVEATGNARYIDHTEYEDEEFWRIAITDVIVDP